MHLQIDLGIKKRYPHKTIVGDALCAGRRQPRNKTLVVQQSRYLLRMTNTVSDPRLLMLGFQAPMNQIVKRRMNAAAKERPGILRNFRKPCRSLFCQRVIFPENEHEGISRNADGCDRGIGWR